MFCRKKDEKMKYKTLKKIILFFVIVCIITSVLSVVISIYGYHALLAYVGNPFAMVVSGAAAITLSTFILYLVGNTFLKAYKDSRRNK